MRRATVATLAGLLLSLGCGDDPVEPTAQLAGAYTATVFQVTPTGQAPINVLTVGGSLAVTITTARTTLGTLFLPLGVIGSTSLTANMTGTAAQTGSNVTFQQTEDTFVRDLTWTLTDTGLSVVNQVAGGATFTITLTRQ